MFCAETRHSDAGLSSNQLSLESNEPQIVLEGLRLRPLRYLGLYNRWYNHSIISLASLLVTPLANTLRTQNCDYRYRISDIDHPSIDGQKLSQTPSAVDGILTQFALGQRSLGRR